MPKTPSLALRFQVLAYPINENGEQRPGDPLDLGVITVPISVTVDVPRPPMFRDAGRSRLSALETALDTQRHMSPTDAKRLTAEAREIREHLQADDTFEGGA